MRKLLSPFNAVLTGLLAAMAVLCLAGPAHASYITRYTTVDTGAMTFTGNTLGLDKTGGQNNPGTSGSIGAFITATNPASQAGTFPAGTTLSWSQGSSSAQLNIPAGSTVLYAELIWGGTYRSVSGAPQDVSAYLNNSVTLTTPSGSYSVSPDGSTANTCGDSTHYFYVRSADVTAYVQSAGAGTYTIGGVPATADPNDDSNNCAGWTLAVVYRNTALPIRSMSVFVGSEFTAPTGGSTASAIAGFCVNNTGTINGRLMVSAMEGDINLAGDQMLFGPAGAMQPVSGPNNLSGNFFASQINRDDGTLDTSGTFGTRNSDGSSAGMRQGWDITNVDVSGILQHGQTEASAQGTTNGDGYAISSIGIQVDVGAPVFPTTVMTVDKPTTYVGDTLTYTTRLDNTAGSTSAQSVVYTSVPPPYTSFIPGTVKTSTDGVNYTVLPGANPSTGFNIGSIAVGGQLWIRYQAAVNAVPPSPSPASYVTNSSWTYNFLTNCSGTPLQATTSSNYTTATLIDRLDTSKTASVNTAGGTATITWTITVSNTGLTNTSGSWLQDTVPAGTTYVAGSTKMNGATVSDVGGNMPFSTPGRLINGPGRAAGVVNSGDTVTVVFKSTCPTSSLPITNTATIYPNGTSGTDPSVQAIGSTSTVNADLAAAITDGVTSVIPGNADSYTVTVTNNGPGTVSSLTLAVPLPAAVQSPAYTASTGSYNAATGAWTGLSLASGQHVTLTIGGAIDPAATGTLSVAATVTPPAGVTDNSSGNNTATDNDALTPQADLSVSMTDNQTAALPGSAATYTITVTNNGPSAISSCWVLDAVPANLQSPTFSPDRGTYNSSTQYWSGVNLASGQSAVLTLQGTVQGGSPTIVNSVMVNPPYNTTDPVLTNNTASDIDAVLNLSAAKTVNPSTIQSGGTVTYTITMTSVSSSTTTVTSVVDTLPAGFSYRTGTTTGMTTANPAVAGQMLTWNGSWTLPANGTLTLHFQSAAGSSVGTFTNTASYAATGYPAASTGPTAPVTVFALKMTKTASQPAVIAGGTVGYTMTLTSYSGSPTTVTSVVDTLPAGFSCKTGTTTGMTTANPAVAGQTLTWNGSWTLPANGTLTLNFQSTAGTTDGTYNNNASFSAAGYPDTSTGPTAPVTVFHLNIAKTAASDSVVAGGTASYTIAMTNPGSTAIPVTSVTDTLPAGFSYNSGTTTGMTAADPAVAGQTLTWNGSWTLPANGTLTLHFSATASGTDGTYYNNASFTPTGYPVQSTGNTAPVTVFHLGISKTVTPGEVTRGGTVTYTITLSNTGPTGIPVTRVTETLNSSGGNFSYVSGSTSGMTSNNPGTAGQTLTWNGSWTLPANGALTLNFDVRVNNTNGTYSNPTATFTATGYGVQTISNTAPVTVSTYDINKTVSPSAVMSGGEVVYTITMTNNSWSNRTVTSVVDTLPAGFSYKSGSTTGTTTNDPSIAGQALTWNGNWRISGHGTLTLVFHAYAGSTPGTYYNNADWSISGQTTYPTGDTAPVTVFGFGITKSASPSTTPAAGTIGYTVTMTNTGPFSVPVTQVTDTLPAGFSYKAGTTTGMTAANPSGTTGTITWNGSWTLPATGTLVLNFQAAAATVSGTYTNSATFSPTGYPAQSVSGAAPVTVTNPHITLTKSADKSSAKPGSAITYTVDYKNDGTGGAAFIIITDTIPANTTYVAGSMKVGNAGSTYATATPVPDNLSGGGVVFDVSGTLAPGGEGKVYFMVTIN
jgi:uncharacterized repeat protein (TIGR01451 family)